MNNAQQEQLYNQIKNLSDEQLANLLQQNDPHKSSMALGEINYRNDVRAAKAMQMDKPPTVAEQQLAKAGIGAGGIPVDPNTSLAVTKGVGALPDQMAPFARDNTGILGAETPMTMTAAGGGLVALANGGLPEDYVPFSEQNMLQRWGGFLGGGDSDFTGDIGRSWDDYKGRFVENPFGTTIDTIDKGLVVGGGLGLGRMGLKAALKFARERGLGKKAMKQIRKLYTKRKELETKGDGFVMTGGSRTVPTRIKGSRGTIDKRIDTKKYDPYKREIDPVRAAGASYIGLKGIGALTSDDDAAATPAKQRELMGPPKPSDDLIAANQKAAELQERLKAAQDAAAKAGENVQPEGRGRSFLSSLATAPEIAGIVAGLTTAEEGLAKGAAAGIKTLQGQQEQELKREQLEDLKEYRDKTTELQEKQMKLVFDAAMAKTGLSTKDLGKLRIDFNKQYGDSIETVARDNLNRAKDKTGVFGLFQADITADMVEREAKKLEEQRFREFIIQMAGGTSQLNMLSSLDNEIYSRAETPVAGIGVGS